MAAIAPVLRKERVTHEEFWEWCTEDIKADLIDGIIVVQTPASQTHERLFQFLLYVIGLYVSRKTLGQVLGSRTAVKLMPGHTYEPDLLFVSREREQIIKEMEIDGPPDLVVEILSASTYRYDTGDKRAGYERSGVRELWLIDPYGIEGTEMLVRDDASGTFVPAPFESGVYRSRALPGFYLRAEWLWPGGPFPDVLEVLRELGVL